MTSATTSATSATRATRATRATSARHTNWVTPEKAAIKTAPALRPDFGRSIGFVAGGMGDQIYHLTQLRALAGASRNGTIDLACIHPGPLAALLANTPWVGTIIDAREFRRYLPVVRRHSSVTALRAEHYDSGFILHRSTSFKMVAKAAGIKVRAGLCDGWLDRFLLNHPLDLADGGERRQLWGHRPFIAAIDAYIMRLGLALDTATPTIMPSQEEMAVVAAMVRDLPRPLTIINMFALDEGRRWPLDAAVALMAQRAAETGGSFLLNAGPDAADYYHTALQKWQQLADRHPQMKKIKVINSVQNTPSMARDVALYHQADAYIGVDSFTANLAMNCNLPAVVLFAHERDVLRYRDAVQPLVAPDAGKIASINNDDINAAASQLGEKWGQKSSLGYPLPV